MPDSYLENLRVTYTTLDKLAEEASPSNEAEIRGAMITIHDRIEELEAEQNNE